MRRADLAAEILTFSGVALILMSVFYVLGD